MHDYILAWIPAIVFLVCSYFYRRGLRRLRLSIKGLSDRTIGSIKGSADRSTGSFKSIEEKMDAIHAEIIRNLRLYGLDTKG
jgi:hypothetical protein